MPTQDEEIARHLRKAAASGELTRLPGYGKPLPEDPGWSATPEGFRMPFKILKNAGIAPPAAALFHDRAALVAALDAQSDPAQRRLLEKQLSDLQRSGSSRCASACAAPVCSRRSVLDCTKFTFPCSLVPSTVRPRRR
jgi:hypothetical protein